MPDLSSSKPENLKLIPDNIRLYPKFQSYKLQTYSEDESLRRIPLTVPPARPVLPNNARVGFQDVRVRTGWNHLSQGWEGRSVLYIGTGGEIVRIQQGQILLAARIPLGSRIDVYGYYPGLVEIGPDMIVATDGLGQLFVLRDGVVIGSSQEEIPFIIFDAQVEGNKVNVLVCQAQHPSSEATSSNPASRAFSLRKLQLDLSSSLRYVTTISLSGTEIPKHAILTPDILLVTSSPFRLTSGSSDPDEMLVDEVPPPPPLYTYFQTETDLDISIPLPLVTPKSSIQITISTSTLQLHFLPPASDEEPDLSETFPFQTVEEKPLWGVIDPMNSTWTLSTSPSGKVLDIHLEKIQEEGVSRWPRVFEDEDGAEEYTDPSERRVILENLEKYTQSGSGVRDPSGEVIRRRFLLEEDEDIDSVEAGDIIQYFKASHVAESHGHDLLALPFTSRTLGIKVSIDMCVFDVLNGHSVTFPAFSFVASSKRLRKYSRYTDEFALIVESGRGGNMYVYYLPHDGVVSRQIVVKLGVDSMGVGLISGEGVVIIGEGAHGFEALLVEGLS
jgi:hypothetical protein